MRALDVVRSVVVCVNLLLRVSVGLDLDTLDASKTLRVLLVGQVLLTLAQRHQLRCVFELSSPEDLFMPSQRPGQSMCALVLRDVCES